MVSPFVMKLALVVLVGFPVLSALLLAMLLLTL